MPELPEVEYAASCLRRWLLGERVVHAVAEPTRLLRGQAPQLFAEQLSGRTLERVERLGKYLLLEFDRGVGLLMHLGMTGKLVRRPAGTREPYSHARFELDSGLAVHFRDPRKFGRLQVGPFEALRALPEVAALGPDAQRAGLDAGLLRERFRGSRRPVKVALMEQSVLAGLGNIHAAEALFRSGLAPGRQAGRLRADQLERLAQAIRETIDFGLKTIEAEEGADVEYVEEGGRNPFLVYGRGGEPCSRCGRPIRSLTQGGRTTYFCATCQR